jgi:hypothetical protein
MSSSANKRKRPSRDAESRDDSPDSCVGSLTLRNKLQRSDCSDVGSSYNKLMLRNILTDTVPTPTPTPTQQHRHTQQQSTPTSNSDTQHCWSTPNNHYHNHNNITSSSNSRQNDVTTCRTPAVLVTTTDVALLIKELLELCGSNYNYSNNHTDNWKRTRDKLWKKTRDKLWLLGDAAYQSEGARDAIGHMGGCLVVTQCLKASVQAAKDMHTAHAMHTTADLSSLLSTLLAVQESACFCLTNLTYRHPANRHRLMAAGGVSVLVSVLRAYTGPMYDDSETTTVDGSTSSTSGTVGSQVGTVLSRACMVLDNLAASESCQEEIVQADVMEAVCATMLAFSDARELQFSGCRILGRLAESCQNGKQEPLHQQQVRLRAVRANAVVAVARAFERFCQTDAATARMASAALQCLTALWSDSGNDPDTERASC